MKRFIILSILVMAQISAMDQQASAFAPIPVDVLDYLTKLLTLDDTETEEEFIARTKAMIPTLLPDDCKHHSLFNELPGFCKETPMEKPYNQRYYYLVRHKGLVVSEHDSKKTVVACSPYGTNIILLQQLKNDAAVVLKIIHNGKEKMLREKTIVKKDYSHLAVSSMGDMFATIDTTYDDSINSRCIEEHCKSVITVQSLVAGKKQEEVNKFNGFNLSQSIVHPTIAFNKQGTLLIIHGSDWYKQLVEGIAENLRHVQHHIIVPVTINTRKVPVTLQKYFKQKGVCKKLILQ